MQHRMPAMRSPFDDPVFVRIAHVHGVTKGALGDVGTGIAWRMTPVFDVDPVRYLEGLPRDLPPFEFVRYSGDADPALTIEIKSGGRGAQAIEYIHTASGTRILLLRDRTIPETAISMLGGRPLGDLVRHHLIPEGRIVSITKINEDKDLKILIGPMPGG